MAEQEDIRKLSGGASLLALMVAAVVGWAVMAGAGYSVWQAGRNVVAAWSGSPPATETVDRAPSEAEIRELLKLTPAAGGPATK